MRREKTTSPRHGSKSLTIVGLGNIGAPLAADVARIPQVNQVTLIDPDVYEAKNVISQDILPTDVGKPKATAQARRLRRINPSLTVVPLARRVEDVPLGEIRADVILACLDSKIARRAVNQAAWRLGVPWIDAGVNAAQGLLAKTAVYVPSENAPCLECAWGDEEYETLEQVHPCDGDSIRSLPTNAPSSLGRLAAALQAIECQKLLAGNIDHAASAQQILIDALNHTHYVTKFTRNPNCPFDHRVWNIRKLSFRPGEFTFGQALDFGGNIGSQNGSILISVEGRPFVRKLQCLGCGAPRDLLRLQGRLRAPDFVCAECSGKMAPVGFEMQDRLDLSCGDNGLLTRKLSSAGFRSGDVFSIRNSCGKENYYEIGGR